MTRRCERVGVDWATPESFTWQHVEIELLQDIRAELRELNALLHYPNFTGIPATLRAIARRLPARRRRARK
jgi:hypothetical protein